MDSKKPAEVEIFRCTVEKASMGHGSRKGYCLVIPPFPGLSTVARGRALSLCNQAWFRDRFHPVVSQKSDDAHAALLNEEDRALRAWPGVIDPPELDCR